MATTTTAAQNDTSFSTFYMTFFVGLLILLWIFRKVTASSSTAITAVSGDFKSFQYNYIAVYLLMMAADWLQGPYVYALYTHYGFTINEIGVLFTVGFGSSLVFGTIVGSLADRYGRKRLCIVFGILYAISCITKHSASFHMLLFGRFLGGIATSILFSAFESWMVHEHHEASYPQDWMSITFAMCTSGNGIVAIGAGVVASTVRDTWGPVAPFDASLIILIIGTVIVATSWRENYGDAHINIGATLANAWSRVVNDRKIAMLGFTQSFFEGAMYVFVFMWTPALESTSDQKISHGWIFASFMICTVIGSNLFRVLMEQGHKVERIMMYMLFVASAIFIVPAMFLNHTLRLVSFFVFEICVGMFWPCMGMMRGKYVPEEVRATIMNFFRVPLNLIVCFVLSRVGDMSEFMVFCTCSVCLLPALICQVNLVNMTVEAPANVKKGTASETQPSHA